MIPAKCGLDPLVECPEQEPTEIEHDVEQRPILENEPTASHKSQKATELQRKASDENQRCRSRATPSKSTDGVRPKKCGSRLSLTSIFNFTGIPGYARERSRSGWSYSDDVNTAVAMTSVSANDIRSAVSGSVSSRRYRGSDTGSCMDGGSEICSDLLLPEEEEECVEDKETKVDKKEKVKPKMRECPLCAARMPSSSFPRLRGCQHRSCRVCLRQYIEISITENRVEVPCPECTSFLHPSDITLLVGDNPILVEKYHQFSLRRFLLTETDARWCPAPDCGYAVIAAKCAACPQLQCQREECGMLFCYHCKREWHNNQTCDEARRGEKRKSRNPAFEEMMRSSAFAQGQESTLKPGDVKACPRCRTYIVKMDDGSCNHMVCTMCNAEFCWLCLKEISDLHYLSPTGCTFWGKKPWTRKKKLLWQLGTLVGAPVGIALIAGLSIPGIIFGVPVFVGKKVHQRFKYKSKAKRRVLTATCVLGSFVVSPVMAVMAVGVGVPIMLAYVYGVVPLSLCRNGGCGLARADSDASASVDEEQLYGTSGVGTQVDFSQYLDGKREEVVSIDPSINSALSVPNDGRVFLMTPLGELSRRRTSIESSERVNYEEASVKAMNGSHHYDDKSLHTLGSGHEVTSIGDELASTKALAGSAMETKSLSESVYRHLAAKYAERNGDVEDRFSATDEHCEESRADDVPSSSIASSSSHSKHRPSSSGLRTCAIEHGEDVLLLSEEAAAMLLNSSVRSSHSGSQAESHNDVFKIRTWLDNMKQMVATDVPQEKPYEPTSRPPSKLRRTGSGKSVQTMNTVPAVPVLTPNIGASNVSMPETGTTDNVSVHSTSSKRRKRLGFFSNWFNKSK